MKKVLMIVLSVVISVAFVTVVFAQAPAGTSEQKTTTTTTTTTPEKKVTNNYTKTTKKARPWDSRGKSRTWIRQRR